MAGAREKRLRLLPSGTDRTELRAATSSVPESLPPLDSHLSCPLPPSSPLAFRSGLGREQKSERTSETTRMTARTFEPAFRLEQSAPAANPHRRNNTERSEISVEAGSLLTPLFWPSWPLVPGAAETGHEIRPGTVARRRSLPARDSAREIRQSTGQRVRRVLCPPLRQLGSREESGRSRLIIQPLVPGSAKSTTRPKSPSELEIAANRLPYRYG
jgi:hypothetical protein